MKRSVSDNARRVLESRYLRRDRQGRILEDAEGLFRRVAGAVAAAEGGWGGPEEMRYWEELFFETMSQGLFLPNSPTLMNAGTPLSQLSACFVLPVPDSMEGIFDSLKQAALIQQSGGGTGFNFSRLRPRNDLISKTGGTASGPVSFMKIFDAATEYVKQGGKRRGANMGILRVDHPDILEFIDVKREPGILRNFNISVAIPDPFMQAVEANLAWTLRHPGSGEAVQTLQARDIWDRIVENAWAGGDPGMIFLDTINAANPTPELGFLDATNPCGEVPLLPYEACNLGSLNLARFVKTVDGRAAIDWDELNTVIRIAVRFLDDVIEVNNYLFTDIQRIVRGNRKIGLGVMGWADLLCLLEIPYASGEAITLADKLMQFIEAASTEASAGLALQRGTFPNWERSIFYPNRPLRNATRTSIAPTGTISILADTSSSIEPIFALAFERQHILHGETLATIHPFVLDYLHRTGEYTPALEDQIRSQGTLQGYPGLSDRTRSLFRTALEIDPVWHLRHQVAFQHHVDNAVSKTINLPREATVKEVAAIYFQAWKLGAKGITVYRQFSRSGQVLQPGLQTGDRACRVCPA
ncbi:MAG TPA: adenosylcobalamin-dependent ribonucleoside-diphosphate reductase [Chitinophagaceae bacterium]|nr:adenosylcobalamin-dependent ribonucleoside-diphosphate reductase [Chitinophagaceae bacterium]